MWFGTKDGLDRYDGVSFRHFKYDRNNPRSLGNNFVTSLYEDIEGNIWVGTDVGVYIYYPEKDTFRHFVEQSDKHKGGTSRCYDFRRQSGKGMDSCRGAKLVLL